MKLSVLFLLIAIHVNAAGFGQELINIRAESMSIQDVFKKIEDQTKYRFYYSSTDLPLNEKFSVNISNAGINQTLARLLTGQPLKWKIVGKNKVILSLSARPYFSENQYQTVTGIVKDSSGTPVVGASVTLKGTTNGVITNSEGVFSIEAKNGDVLVVSSVGYEDQEIPITDQVNLGAITLMQSTNTLEDVVVIGYGTVSRKNVSGAVATVKGSDMNLSTNANFTQALQGKAAGVQALQSTGQPGAGAAIKIRSNPSNSSLGVLYVIDGVPINGGASQPGSPMATQSGQDQSPLNFINPNDIESIDFLKDAASSSIYGARAGAGVVLITTKRGKIGKPRISYSGSYGFQKASKMYDVLDTKTYMQQINMIGQEMWMQSNKIAPYYGTVLQDTFSKKYNPVFTQQQIDGSAVYPSAMEAITRSGYTQQHNVSVTGGTDKTRYFFSGNYFDQKGVIIATDYKRYNFRFNFDQNLADNLKLGINALMSNGTTNSTGTGGRYEAGGIIASALYYPANQPLIDEEGNYPLNPRYTSVPNPLSYETVLNQARTFRLLTNAYLSWEIVNGLTAKGSYSFDQSTAKRDFYAPTTYSQGAQVGGLASLGSNSSNIKLLEYTLNYDKKIGAEQKINATAGYSYNQLNTESMYESNSKFPSDFLYYDLSAGQNPSPSVSSGKTQKVIASYFARAIYTLKDRYTLQASLRRDGASNFATNKKWGYFPGVAASWLITEEPFLQSASFLNFLKLRASYGTTGNSDFVNPATGAVQSAFEAFTPSTGYVFGTNSPSVGIIQSRLGNPDLSWETAKEINVGLDFGLFSNRLTGSLDWFRKTIDGLIYFVPTPADFTVNGRYINAGTTRSTGYDIGLQSKNIIANKEGGFTWSTSVSFSHYLNYWVARAPQALATLSRYIAPSGKNAVFNGAYGYTSTGIYKGDGNVPAWMPGLLPGSLIVSDIASYDANGNIAAPDGKISAADQTLLANLDPKFNFGFGNSFSYKHFDLNVFFSGASLKAWSPYAPNMYFRVASMAANTGTYGWNTMPISLERWTFQNPDANFPTGLSSAAYSSYQNNSSYWMVDASYLRCRNITLGYSLPANALKGQKIVQGIRISFDVQNPFTITNYPGMDPELNQNNYYPLTKSYVLGLNLNF